MSDQYSGHPANVTRPAVNNIASSTNTTPIVVVTAVPHLLTTGDTVRIAGHAANVSANGIWPITVTGVDRFELDGSVGTAPGVATGTAMGQGVQPTYAVEDDGDNADAASMGVGLEALGDRTAYLAERLGEWKVLERVLLPPVSVAEPPTVRVTWTQAAYTAGPNLVGTLTSPLVPGDVVLWRMQLTFYLGAGAEDYYCKAQREAGGSAVVDIPTGSSRVVLTGNAAGARFDTVTMIGSEVIPANFVHNATTGYRLYLIGRSAGSPLILNNNSTFELVAMRRTP